MPAGTVLTSEGHRFQAWAASIVFSSVCMAAHVSTAGTGRLTGAQNWVIAMLSFQLLFGLLALLGYSTFKDKFVNEKPEGVLVLASLVFWCAGLATIMNPSRNIAVSGGFGATIVLNANLYFFSWTGFIATLFLCGSYLQEVTGRDVASELTPKESKWMGLLASTIVILAAASDIHASSNCFHNLRLDFCSRNAYAISLGVIGAAACLAVLFLHKLGKLTIAGEFAVSAVLIVMYTFGVAFVTFGTGPGTTIGNLYFSTWIAFTISVFLAFQCFREVLETRGRGSSSGGRASSSATSATAPASPPASSPAAAPTLEDVELSNTTPAATEAVEAEY